MYFWNDREEKIIGTFINNIDSYEEQELILKWEDGSEARAIFDSYIEDESDCDMDEEEYEEFWSFVFKGISISGQPPIIITEDDYFMVNYLNFPKEIFAGNIQIS